MDSQLKIDRDYIEGEISAMYDPVSSKDDKEEYLLIF